MLSKNKTQFLESVPLAKLNKYRNCLQKRGRPSKECVPIREEFKAFTDAPKAKVASKAKAASEAKPSKPMTVAEKCKKTPIKKCDKPCKVFTTPSGKYCRKLKTGSRKSSAQEKKTLSMMA